MNTELKEETTLQEFPAILIRENRIKGNSFYIIVKFHETLTTKRIKIKDSHFHLACLEHNKNPNEGVSNINIKATFQTGINCYGKVYHAAKIQISKSVEIKELQFFDDEQTKIIERLHNKKEFNILFKKKEIYLPD